MTKGPLRKSVIGWMALVAALGLLVAPVWASEGEEHPGTQESQGAHGQAVEHGSEAEEPHAGHPVHHEHKNGLALFLGGTYESAEEETYFTLGLEYERKLADRWAFQLVAEHVNDFDAWVVTAPVGFRLAGTLWALTGPGLETEPRRRGPEAELHGAEGEEGHSTEPHEEEEGPFFLWRFGLAYSIHLGESGRFALTPGAYLDLVRENGEWVEAWVFGVGLTYHF